MFLIFSNLSISEALLSKLEQAKMFRTAKKYRFLRFHILIQFGEQITSVGKYEKNTVLSICNRKYLFT